MGLPKDMNRSLPGNFKRFRNKDCLECVLDSGEGTSSGNLEAECYNPFIRQNSRYGKIKQRSFYKETLSGVLDSVLQNQTAIEDKISFDEMFDGLVKSFQKSSIPDSISIFINYGTENNHILYDASGVNHHCSQIQIWDPFSEICRDVYCAADMVLAEYDCEGEPNNNSRYLSYVLSIFTIPAAGQNHRMYPSQVKTFS